MQDKLQLTVYVKGEPKPHSTDQKDRVREFPLRWHVIGFEISSDAPMEALKREIAAQTNIKAHECCIVGYQGHPDTARIDHCGITATTAKKPLLANATKRLEARLAFATCGGQRHARPDTQRLRQGHSVLDAPAHIVNAVLLAACR